MPASKKLSPVILYGLAIAFFLAYVFVAAKQFNGLAGWLLMLLFLSLAGAFRSSKVLRGLSFTMVIIAVVSLAMYYPAYFRNVGDFRLSLLIVPLLQVIMFGMGTELSLKDFARVLSMPKGIIVGVVCHYTIMPLIGFAIASLFNFPGEIAAGIILLAVVPVGWPLM
jgi:BASS family bile acid:Na+ symporter